MLRSINRFQRMSVQQKFQLLVKNRRFLFSIVLLFFFSTMNADYWKTRRSSCAISDKVTSELLSSSNTWFWASLKSRDQPSFKNLAMLLFLTLIVSAAAFEKAVLKSGLKSTAAQLKLFRKWTENEHKKFGAKENAFRFVFTDFSWRKNLSTINGIMFDFWLGKNSLKIQVQSVQETLEGDCRD